MEYEEKVRNNFKRMKKREIRMEHTEGEIEMRGERE
jgi:hypothetical protein